MTYRNPPNFQWGTVKDGEATGLFKDIVEDKVDFALGDIFADYERSRVCVYSSPLTYGDTLMFASPRGTSYRSMFTLIRPFQFDCVDFF